ncbi:MAG: peptide deformylase [Candidatus Caenarcaniphilales bacterium]|nr:peptide deformylase [Candidatus Caenarcaniphilales bacterium]
MIFEVLQFGNEVLRKPCKEVDKKEIKSKTFRKFINRMLNTMYEYQGVGLAAPQVGSNKRVITIDVDWPNGKENPMVFINPQIVYSEGEIESEEGCLSFKGSTIKKEGVLLKKVKRYKKIKVNYKDLENRKQSIEADGDLLSRCLQHEIDHLDGILFIDRDEDSAEVQEELTKNGFECSLDKNI